MSEEPKSNWHRVWSRPFRFFFWLALFSFMFALGSSWVLDRVARGPNWSDFAALAVIGTFAILFVVAFIGLILSLIPPTRPLMAWAIRRWFFCLASLITLIALFYVVENARGKWAWKQFKQEWEAKGERFDWQAIIPPSVPDDQNFALTPVVASSYEMFFDKQGHEIRPRNTNVVDRLSMMTWRDNPWTNNPKSGSWLVAKKTDLQAWQGYFRTSPPTNSARANATNSFPQSPQPQSPAEDVLHALSKYDVALAELRQASRLPYSRFPLTYDKDDLAAILLPHLSALKSAAQALSLRAVAELQLGQTEKAFADLKLALRLADSIRTEPFLISHLVRIQMINLALQPIWEGLADHQWSDAQLTELGHQLTALNFLADHKLSVRGEIGFHVGFFDFLRRQPEQIAHLSNADNSYSPPVEGKIFSRLIPSGWFYQNQLRCTRFMIRYNLPLADLERRTISPTAAKRADDALGAEIGHRNPCNFLEGLLLPALGNAVKKFAQAQSTADLAGLVCALERYRLAHGEYPETLAALAPQFIEKIPRDIIGGQPLHYRRTDDGQFLLYSVGWNEKDDGGAVVLGKGSSPVVNTDQGDWVWPMPAK